MDMFNIINATILSWCFWGAGAAAGLAVVLGIVGARSGTLGPLDLAVLVVTAGIVWLILWYLRRKKKAAPKPPAES
jgi:hypothetical protein